MFDLLLFDVLLFDDAKVERIGICSKLSGCFLPNKTIKLSWFLRFVSCCLI